MNGSEPQEYPPAAYAENGVLWWELKRWPGSKKQKFGAERKLAAWMAFNVEVGETFTIRDLRRALGDEVVPNDDEHLNRRFRELRKDGWEVPSKKDDRTLPTGVYRLDSVGWHPGQGSRPKRNVVSAKVARLVLERDGRRCKVCGIGSGEPHPRNGGRPAVITVGHRRSREQGGSSDDLSNLQAECTICNEPVRQEMGFPESLEELLPDVRNLRLDDLRKLRAWLEQGFRSRDRLDEIYDRARALSTEESAQLRQRVREMLEGRGRPSGRGEGAQ